MKKLFTSLWISFACLAVMVLTGALIVVFYVAVLVRKLCVRNFVPNALKDSVDEDCAPIESAKSQINAVQASFEKTEAQRG